MRWMIPNFSVARGKVILSLAVLGLVATAPPVRAGWFDPAWKFRRPIEVPEKESAVFEPGQLASVQFYANGHSLPNGQDYRVADEDGRLVAMHLLRAGPGDRASLLFEMERHVSRYYVYFGNSNPPAPKPEFADVKITAGLLLDMRELARGTSIGSAAALQEAWEKSPRPLGQTLIGRPVLGINPFGAEDSTVSRLTGSLRIEVEGSYIFALAVHGRGALLIDGKPILFASDGPSDVRFHESLTLRKGRHEFALIHASTGGDGRFVVAWMIPGTSSYEPIPASFFGHGVEGTAGPLEQIRRDLIADFSIQYAGECFFADHFSHRYKFSARGLPKNPRLRLKWDFGDGQSSSAADPEHVYLSSGPGAVTLEVRLGEQSDAQTNRLEVSRDWARIDNPPTDQPPVQSAIVRDYDVAGLPVDELPWAVLLHQRAGKLDAMFSAAARLASLAPHPDIGPALLALGEAGDAAQQAGKSLEMADVLERVPPGSDLQPQAVGQLARLLLWRIGDFQRAVAVLDPFAVSGGDEIKRSLGQALVLAGKPEDGRKRLVDAGAKGDPTRQAALSGAEARTIEFYITQKDPDAGEKAWEQWQRLYPDDFLKGYSVLLQTRLMELQHAPLAAAKVAEAFANAVPGSSYAPELLDRAARLDAASDPRHSAALHQLLKERYPEDPRSQN